MKLKHTTESIAIDGRVNEAAWQTATWYPLSHLMVGKPAQAQDFSGRFKLLWQADALYLLAEIIDDKNVDQHPNPLLNYWDDDCLEIFIDEDASGGEHTTNFNAFAYHLALDNQVVDIGPNLPDGSTNFILLNDHVENRWQRTTTPPHPMIWEAKIYVYDDSFTLDNKQHQPVALTNNKVLGFMLAYCDNDGAPQREHFYGSTAITPVNGDKNLGYKDASVFSRLTLLPPKSDSTKKP